MKAAEQEDFAGIAIELAEGDVEECVFVAGDGVVASVRTIVRVVGEVLRIRRDGGGGRFAEVIGGAAAGEVIHPGGEAAVVAIGVAVFEHPLKNGLRDVLGSGALAGEFYEEAKEWAVVAFEENAKRIEFAVADGEHEIVIGERFGGGVHGGASVLEFNHDWARRNTNICGVGDHGVGRASLW